MAEPASGIAPASPDGIVEETVPLNPLVAAYAESLAARGISADNQGFILTTMDGEVLAEHNADRGFNPASVVKVATSLTAISKLGPDFRFRTTMYTDGVLDPSTGTLKGSVYLVGSGDPAFFLENALLIVDNLNRNGIHSIEGDLYVLGPFFYNFSTSREASARALRGAITTDKWTAAMKTAYPRFLAMRSAIERQNGKQKIFIPSGYQPDQPPNLKISGQTITDSSISTSGLRPLAVHTSLPLVRVLKALNDFSNNWMAHVIGNMVGGPDAVARFLTTDVGLRDEEVRLATSSGLGSNAISPRSTIIILRKLTHYLKTKNLKVEDILPIAGIDAGTLQRRFTDQFRGSVVAKTGTLSGVSALAGVAYTRAKGPLLFVIYNQGASPSTFRVAQDETLKKLITLFGGPAPVYYAPAIDIQVSDGKTPSMSSPK
jgi:D-alanyl-D-alanine carboxypeptidase/D-alanyl-D-alanine-endopeptidase (penicillin-binding protein 4)